MGGLHLATVFSDFDIVTRPAEFNVAATGTAHGDARYLHAQRLEQARR